MTPKHPQNTSIDSQVDSSTNRPSTVTHHPTTSVMKSDYIVFYDGMSDEELDMLLKASLDEDELEAVLPSSLAVDSGKGDNDYFSASSLSTEDLSPQSLSNDGLSTEGLISDPLSDANSTELPLKVEAEAEVEAEVEAEAMALTDAKMLTSSVEEIPEDYFQFDEEHLEDNHNRNRIAPTKTINSSVADSAAKLDSLDRSLDHRSLHHNVGQSLGLDNDVPSFERLDIDTQPLSPTPQALQTVNSTETDKATGTNHLTSILDTPVEQPDIAPLPTATLRLNDSAELQQTSQQVTSDILQLKSHLHLLTLQFHELSNVTARVMNALRQLQSGCKDDFSVTYEQMQELRSQLVSSKQQAGQLPSLLDLVEEALESEMYVAQMRQKR